MRRMIAGLEEITSGTIKIGEPVQKATEILDLGISWTGGPRLFPAVSEPVDRQKSYCFLMVEPLSNLDAKLRVQMLTEISKLPAVFSSRTTLSNPGDEHLRFDQI